MLKSKIIIILLATSMLLILACVWQSYFFYSELSKLNKEYTKLEKNQIRLETYGKKFIITQLATNKEIKHIRQAEINSINMLVCSEQNEFIFTNNDKLGIGNSK